LLGSETERRQLTVLLCDLVGSTSLSARLDPEDMHEIVGAYHHCCAELIERAGGFVAKYMGDGVLAYIGYPQAHEDDAERAVRAALGLTAAIPKLQIGNNPPLQVRVGVATGLVVVGDLVGRGDAQERGVVGDTPNLAARLEALAEPGRVVIAEGTRRLARGLFDYDDLGRVPLRVSPTRSGHGGCSARRGPSSASSRRCSARNRGMKATSNCSPSCCRSRPGIAGRRSTGARNAGARSSVSLAQMLRDQGN
jgi:class 3 adenylate cyclase